MVARIPVAFIFNPNWWCRNYGISFDRSFYLDPERRIADDVTMRRALHERFGLGEPDPQPRPILGSRHVAGGFVTPALFGVEIRFAADQAPWSIPLELSADQIRALAPPDIATTWPMDEIVRQADTLEERFGFVMGDWNHGGLINTAMELRGNTLFTDFTDDPGLVHHLMSVLTETQIRVAGFFKSRSGTNSVAVNRGIVNVDPAIYVQGNCSVQMISPRHYETFFLPYEMRLAKELAPYGIHHCGDNLHLFAKSYSKLPLRFLDVGWGSDVARCRAALPDVFFNIRLSPVRMLSEVRESVRGDVLRLLESGYAPGKTGVCCINMDYGTPDENVRTVLETVAEFAAQRE